MYLTWLDSNSWLIEMGSQRILLDPWLVGTLSFGIDWLFSGKRSSDRPIPPDIDLILLSQGLPDHAHPPTLERLDRSIPVIASPSAAKVVRSLGYSQVIALKPGQSWTLESLSIKAFLGSPIGPFTTENAYLIDDQQHSLYYEPHGYHDRTLPNSIDVVITPLIDLNLPLVGSIIQGNRSAFELIERVQPQVILPTAAGGEIEFAGLITPVLQAVGSVDNLRSQLVHRSISTQVIAPTPGDRIEISLTSRTANTSSNQ
ncbi:MBL fold metallo-hydrolase [Microcoleus sp. FACHB-1515]|uniref:MBL fold metallo-hydrolase n=1 Tax=Cyanophyceae TaxID=3028117 RepID=UPI001687FCE7|nr:MBL fold metallo-hydrolase [Microcoleus sp. FACHB-1515]MBD2092619.1 MBL fold metallo-hydrolase [Microcoleus sp. FACHB-1515]